MAFKIISVVLVLVLFILLKSCVNALSNSRNKNENSLLIREGQTIKIPEKSPLRKQLNVQPVKVSNKPHVIVLPGIIDADLTRNISILPPITGRIVSLNTNLGDQVEKGQILATIQSPAMAQAYTDTIKAGSAFKQAAEAWKRAQKVNRAGANSIKDVEQIQNNYIQAQAELERTQATLTALGQNKDNLLQIQAPIGGKITTLNYGNGSYINDQTIPLFYLSNIHDVWVTVCVPENTIPLIKKDQKVKVQVSAYPEHDWDGQISFTNNLLDSDNRCNKSRIALENRDERLQPNMFATVRAEIPQKEQVMIPLSALVMNNDTTSVFLETAPWTFIQRPVALGSEDGKLVRISSGLKANDRIVAAGGVLIND